MMQICAENIGQVISLDNSPHLIQIEAVTDKLVTYRNELGHRHGTYEREFQGRVIRDQERIRAFERNCELGRFLNAAEQSALNKYFAFMQEPEAREEAAQALRSIRAQQQHLEKSVEARNRVSVKEAEQHQGASGNPRRDSLDSIIRRANAKREAAAPVKDQQRSAQDKEKPEQSDPER